MKPLRLRAAAALAGLSTDDPPLGDPPGALALPLGAPRSDADDRRRRALEGVGGPPASGALERKDFAAAPDAVLARAPAPARPSSPAAGARQPPAPGFDFNAATVPTDLDVRDARAVRDHLGRLDVSETTATGRATRADELAYIRDGIAALDAAEQAGGIDRDVLHLRAAGSDTSDELFQQNLFGLRDELRDRKAQWIAWQQENAAIDAAEAQAAAVGRRQDEAGVLGQTKNALLNVGRGVADLAPSVTRGIAAVSDLVGADDTAASLLEGADHLEKIYDRGTDKLLDEGVASKLGRTVGGTVPYGVAGGGGGALLRGAARGLIPAAGATRIGATAATAALGAAQNAGQAYEEAATVRDAGGPDRTALATGVGALIGAGEAFGTGGGGQAMRHLAREGMEQGGRRLGRRLVEGGRAVLRESVQEGTQETVAQLANDLSLGAMGMPGHDIDPEAYAETFALAAATGGIVEAPRAVADVVAGGRSRAERRVERAAVAAAHPGRAEAEALGLPGYVDGGRAIVEGVEWSEDGSGGTLATAEGPRAFTMFAAPVETPEGVAPTADNAALAGREGVWAEFEDGTTALLAVKPVETADAGLGEPDPGPTPEPLADGAATDGAVVAEPSPAAIPDPATSPTVEATSPTVEATSPTVEPSAAAPPEVTAAPGLDAETAPSLDAGAQVVAPPDVAPRAEGEPFDGYLARSRGALAAESDAEVEAAVAEGEEPSTAAAAVAETSENPVTVLRGWRAAREAEAVALDPAQSVEAAIAEHLPAISSDEAADVSGDLTAGQRRAYFRAPRQGRGTGAGEGRARASLAEAAAEVSEASGFDVSAEDVAQFIRDHPNGPEGYRADVRRQRRRIEGRLREVTGAPVSAARVEGYLAALDAPGDGAPPAIPDAPGENGDGYGARNTLVTTDAYREALASLGQVSPFMNPGANPEMWAAAGRVAAYHAEALAREGIDAAARFADFSARMVRDVGHAVEPHLRALYDGAVAEVGETEPRASGPAPVAAQDAADAPATPDVGGPAGRAPAAGGEAGSADNAPMTDTAAAAAPSYAAALNRAEIERARDALGLDDLPTAQRQTWAATLDDVVGSGLHLEAEGLARSMVSDKSRAPFSPREHVAVLVALVRAQRSYRETAALARQTEAEGGPTEQLQRDAARHLGTVDLLTAAGQRSGREAGLALAVRAVRLEEEAGRFTISRVLDDGRVLKGAALTADERGRLASLAETVEGLTRRLAQAEATAAAARAEADRTAAERAVGAERQRAEREGRTRAEREGRRHALREERAGLLDDLARLGLRVNDVTGLSADAAVLVAKLGRNVAAEFGLSLADTVDRVRALLPDVAEADIVRALSRDDDAPAGGDARQAARAADKAEREADRLRIKASRARKAVRAAQSELAPRTAKEVLGAVVGFPRSLLASFDMSGVLNQAAPLVRRHPVQAAQTFGRTFSTFFRSVDAERLDLALRSDPMQPKREAAGLYLAPQGEGAAAASLTEREEALSSRLFDRAPWWAHSLAGAVVGAASGTVKLGPGVGTAVGAAFGAASRPIMRMSEDHMVSFLNLLRASVFDTWARAHPDATPEETAAYARVVNLLTGRGEMSADLATVGGVVLFSPRMTVGRFQALGAAVNPKAPASARREAASALGLLVASNLGTLALLDWWGEDDVDVTWDPRSSDFGKLRWGSLRIDPWGGYSQIARLAGRLTLSATDAYGLTETPADRREVDPTGEAGRYGQGKLAPWVGITESLLTRKDWMGDPTTAREVLAGATLPIGIQSTAEATEGTAPMGPAGRAALVFGLNWFGVGAGVYDDPTARSSVIQQFERAHVTRYATAPEGLSDAEKIEFRDDFRRRLAGKVEAALPSLRRTADAGELAERLKAMKAEAREEAVGVAEDDPLKQGLPLALLRRAGGYSPSAGRPEGLTDGQRAARDSAFGRRLAEMVERDAAVLEPETDPDALRARLSDLAERARAEGDGDPLAPALPVLQWAGYDARPYPPSEMPDGERAAYGDDFGRRLAALVEGETPALSGMTPEEAKGRLRSLAATARQQARGAAGY